MNLLKHTFLSCIHTQSSLGVAWSLIAVLFQVCPDDLNVFSDPLLQHLTGLDKAVHLAFPGFLLSQRILDLHLEDEFKTN